MQVMMLRARKLTAVQEVCVFVDAESPFSNLLTQLSAPACSRQHLATRPRHSSRPPPQPAPSLKCQRQLPRCCLPCRWETCMLMEQEPGLLRTRRDCHAFCAVLIPSRLVFVHRCLESSDAGPRAPAPSALPAGRGLTQQRHHDR